MNREHLFRNAIGDNNQRIFRICNYFFIDRDDRNDAYQETLIRIWENLHSFKGNSLLSTWIYRVAVNTCLSHIRSRNQRNNLIESTIDPEILLIPESAGSENDFIEENKMIFLQQFLLNLSMADRTLVSLYLENLSTKEMAEVTGMSETNLRVRIHRIKEKIKKEWEEKQNGTG